MSHSQLVLRSFKEDDSGVNLDIIFFGVNEIRLEVTFESILIEWEKGNIEGSIIFTVNGGQVNCSFFNVIENNFDFAETSIFKDINSECRLIYSSSSGE